MKKNRWTAPQTYSDMTIADIISLPHDLLTAAGAEDRDKWTPATASQSQMSEGKAVRITGYFVSARKEGPEACNGNDSNYNDFHLWIADSAGKGKQESLIAEATPYWEEQYPKWLFSTFTTLSNQHVQVRISGWIMWDEDHLSDVGSSRASLWEIHPMTKFEYFSNGVWQTL